MALGALLALAPIGCASGEARVAQQLPPLPVDCPISQFEIRFSPGEVRQQDPEIIPAVVARSRWCTNPPAHILLSGHESPSPLSDQRIEAIRREIASLGVSAEQITTDSCSGMSDPDVLHVIVSWNEMTRSVCERRIPPETGTKP